MELTEEIPRSNQIKLECILYLLILILFTYLIFLPKNWHESFGPLSFPLKFAAEYVPAIRKLVIFGSPKEFTEGMLGFAAWIPVIYAFCFVWYGFFDRTDPNNIRLIVGTKGHYRIHKERSSLNQIVLKDNLFYILFKKSFIAVRHKDMNWFAQSLYFVLLMCFISFYYILPFSELLFSPENPDDWPGFPDFFDILNVTISTGALCIAIANLLAFTVDFFVLKSDV